MTTQATIRFGPAGLGPVKEALKNLEEYHRLGFTTCEIAFTYGPYIKEEADARRIGEKAKDLGIELRIHAPYFVNLNAEEKEKRGASRGRIMACLKVGTWLGAKIVVFHPGYYGKGSRENAYDTIKEQVLKLQEERTEKGYTPELAPETMGKVNVFGSIEEISQLVKDTGCTACIDFAHILARDKDYRFKDTLAAFRGLKKLYLHFSGIEYNEKGERKHLPTKKEEWDALLNHLPKNKEISIVNESPRMVEDSVEGLKRYLGR